MSTPIENNTEELQEILQTVNNLPNLGSSGSSDVFVAHVTLDENWENIVAVDKTYEEIAEAITNRKLCFVELQGNVLSLSYCDFEYGEITFSYYGDGYTVDVYFSPDEAPFFSSYESPYMVELGGIPDNGNVVSGSVSDLGAFYNSASRGMIKLYFVLVDSETSEPVMSYSAPASLVFFETPTSYGFYARAFIKEGYIDVSFTDTNGELRYEASFKRMA